MLFQSPILQFLFVAVMSLWFFGWVGSVFLSSTRVVFATAFDRVLPEWVSRTTSTGVPYAALLLMLIPSIPISYMYAFGENFATYVLDAVLVIAITFLGSTVSAALMPWLKPDIYNASPITRYNVLGIPLITVAAAAFGGFLIFCIYQWFFNDLYGVNNGQSLDLHAGPLRHCPRDVRGLQALPAIAGHKPEHGLQRDPRRLTEVGYRHRATGVSDDPRGPVSWTWRSGLIRRYRVRG